jgi:hypothetical protein
VLLLRAVESCGEVEGGRGGIPRDRAGIAPRIVSAIARVRTLGTCPRVFIWIKKDLVGGSNGGAARTAGQLGIDKRSH